MTSDRPDRSRDDAEEPKVRAPESTPIADPTAKDSLREMDAAKTRGTTSALDEIDRGGAPEIVDSSRRRPGADVPGGKDHGMPDDEPPPRSVPYTVRKGDTLWSISAREQTDNGNTAKPTDTHRGVFEILNANPGLDPNGRLREGQKINIPETIRTGYRQEGREIPGAPTALVLDIFSSKGTAREVADTSHGGILSAGFNALGFNVIRANIPEGDPLRHTSKGDYSEAMRRAANFIEANPDKFKRGDGSFVNTSFGNNRDPRDKDSGDLTYKQLSKMVGMEVNAENMKQSTDEVLRRLGLVAEGKNPVTGQPDTKITKREREIAGAAVRTNEQIERINKLGVEVVHSAGNDGKDRVDINFLRATQLRSDAPHGDKPLKFSGVGSHTEHGAGVIPFHLSDKNTLVADINGYIMRLPVDKSVKFDKRDHVINYDAMVKGDASREFQVRRRGQQIPWDVEGFTRGFAQRTYNLGPVVDYAPGTSFSPLSYIAHSRKIQRPPEF